MTICRTRKILQPLYGLIFLVFLNSASANSEELRPLGSIDGVIDQWKAFQTSMYDHGILMETTNTVDVLSNVSGGIHRKPR
jgi:hypothetical protein